MRKEKGKIQRTILPQHKAQHNLNFITPEALESMQSVHKSKKFSIFKPVKQKLVSYFCSVQYFFQVITFTFQMKRSQDDNHHIYLFPK